MTRAKKKKIVKKERHSTAYMEKEAILRSMPVDDLLEFMGYPTTTKNTLEEAQETKLDKMIVQQHIVGGEAT